MIENAVSANPEFAAAKARADVARGQLIQAGLYPNPTIGWRAEEMSLNKAAGGQQGPYINQEIVTGGKLQIAQAAAAHGVTAADWQAVTRWFDVVTRIRVAYYEVLTAERELEVSREVEALLRDSLRRADKLQQDGSMMTYDVKKTQVELMMAENRRGAAERRLEAALKKLAAVVGLPRQSIPALAAKLTPCPHSYDWTKVAETVLTRSSEVQEAQALVRQAQDQARLAEAQVTPNVQVQLRPAYDIPDRNAMLFVEAGVAWPLFNRNQGNILAARAEVGRGEAEVRQVETRLAERLAEAFRRFEDARRQTSLLQSALKDAEEALRLVRISNANDARVTRYLDVLDAQRTLAQVRLDLIEAQGDAWKASSELEGLLQAEPAPVPTPGTGGSPCIILP
jgi:cobalt-zinc-cadmium efflux system outer membrane protein